jgi:hypothetical protein
MAGHHNGMTDQSDLARRIERLEATEAIRQLASRYALALDSRDVQTLASLFVPDVETATAASAARRWPNGSTRSCVPMRRRSTSSATTSSTSSTTTTPTGVVYCRPEHEVGDLWVVMPMQYWDRYERRDGEWWFKSRKPVVFYAADILEHPLRGARPLQLPEQSRCSIAPSSREVGHLARVLGPHRK